ncbi:MAG: hypothetical protein ACLU38_12125 [Dysosmobacter sp.]
MGTCHLFDRGRDPAFYDTLFGRRVLPSFGGQLLKALQPVLIGAVLAYLLAPVIDFIENLFFPEQMKKAHAEGA